MNYDDSSHSARSPYKTITLDERLKQVKDDFYRGLRENPDRKRESFELDIVEVKHFPNSKIVLTGVAFLKDQRRVLLKCEIDKSSPAYDWWVAKNSGVSRASGGIDTLKKLPRVRARGYFACSPRLELITKITWMQVCDRENSILSMRQQCYSLLSEKSVGTLSSFNEVPYPLNRQPYVLSVQKRFTEIHIISGKNSEALNDIKAKLSHSRHSLNITSHVVPIQSPETARKIQDVLKKLEVSEKGKSPLVIITRGGGSICDFSYLDDPDLISLVRESPLTIATALGHENNHSPLYIAADYSFRTPTEAASRIISAHFDADKSLTKARTEQPKPTVPATPSPAVTAPRPQQPEQSQQTQQPQLLPQQPQPQPQPAIHCRHPQGLPAPTVDPGLKTALMHAENELATLKKRFTRWMLAFLCVGLLVGIIATVLIGSFI